MFWVVVELKARWGSGIYKTPGKVDLEPENGPFEDYLPLQTSGFQVPCESSRVYVYPGSQRL